MKKEERKRIEISSAQISLSKKAETYNSNMVSIEL
jgi:hypothetical protein